MADKKPRYPFIVFRESLKGPDGTNDPERLHDPNVSAEEKAAIRRRLKSDVEVVQSTAERNTQRERHEANHRRRAKVMADLQRDAKGKPLRGEPKRLAKLHGFPVQQVRKWIEQLRKAPTAPVTTGALDWRAVYHGRQLRAWYRKTGRSAKKPKS